MLQGPRRTGAPGRGAEGPSQGGSVCSKSPETGVDEQRSTGTGAPPRLLHLHLPAFLALSKVLKE